MKFTKYQIIALGLLLLNIAYLFFMYSGLPETMPNHFNLKGEADGFGPKKILLALPVVATLVFLIMYAATTSDKYNLPKNVSIETARKSLGQLTVSVQIIFLLISYTSIVTGLGAHNPLAGWTIPMILALTFLPILGLFIKKQ